MRDVEGVPPERFDAVLHRFRAKLAVMADLGATTVLCCSNVGADAVDDPDLSAAQLHALGDLAAEQGVTIAYEALAWGRHVNRVGQAWDVVRRADHPAVTLAVDTFHLLARGDDGAALAGVPGDRIGFLQVADAPLLDMDVLEWSRHFRCFPGEGTLDVGGRRRRDPRRRLRRPGLARGLQRRRPRGRPRRHRARRDAVAGLPGGPARPGAAPPGPGRGRPGVPRGARARPPYPPLLDGARLRARRTAPHQAGHLVAQRRRARRRQRRRLAADPALGVVAAPGARAWPSAPRRCCGRRSTAPAAPARR